MRKVEHAGGNAPLAPSSVWQVRQAVIGNFRSCRLTHLRKAFRFGRNFTIGFPTFNLHVAGFTCWIDMLRIDAWLNFGRSQRNHADKLAYW